MYSILKLSLKKILINGTTNFDFGPNELQTFFVHHEVALNGPENLCRKLLIFLLLILIMPNSKQENFEYQFQSLFFDAT